MIKIWLIFNVKNWLWQSKFYNFWRLLLNWLQHLKICNGLLVFSLKEGLVQCATVCVKSEVILKNLPPVMHPDKVSGMGMATNNSLGTESSWLNWWMEQFLFIQVKRKILSWNSESPKPPIIACPFPSCTITCLSRRIGNVGPVNKIKVQSHKLLQGISIYFVTL